MCKRIDQRIDLGVLALSMRITIVLGVVSFLILTQTARAENPILQGQGACDPDIRIYDGRAYLYATHDADPKAKTWTMHNWWVWSSTDLVHWKQESILQPQTTYYGKPYASCWATTAARKGDKYFFYVSRGHDEVGVVEGDSPIGPWHDPLGQPLLSKASTPTHTPARDPVIFQDQDGKSYIVWGVFDYYIARLNDDMISLAETPRLIQINNKFGPFGRGKTDDKPFLHRQGDHYYLSWGCFYSMSDSVYGPYTYKDSVIRAADTEAAFSKSLTHDRHGCFFEFNNQWYFACNDQSFPGLQPYFRETVISYVHYRANGEIAPVHLTRLGVGQYAGHDAVTQVEDYFAAHDCQVTQCPAGGFEVSSLRDGSELAYPNVNDLPKNAVVCFRVASATGGTIEVHANSAGGPLLGRCTIPQTGDFKTYQSILCPLTNPAGRMDLHLLFHGSSSEMARLDWISFN